MRFRLKSPHGSTIVSIEKETENKTLSGVLNELIIPQYPHIFNESSVSAIKTGFPPRPIDLSGRFQDVVHNGDQLIVELGERPIAEISSAVSEPAADNQSEIPAVYMPELKQYLILRNIPDDNSCMFNAICYAMKKPTSHVGQLRRTVARTIASDRATYNEVILGRSNDDYCEWITKKDSWGGAIELGILSRELNIQINCIDIESGNMIRFRDEVGDGTSTVAFINLIYSGVHYDVVVANRTLSVSESSKLEDEGQWQFSSQSVINKYSEQLAKLLQSRNYTTNTTTFRLRCLQCYSVLVGEMGATKHAESTGHYNFGEVNK